MRKYTPQKQHFDKFDDLIKAAETRYTLSFKDACKALKCSRSWAYKYIKPHVPSIYLQNGKGTGKANYAKIVSKIVNMRQGEPGYSNESVYLDEKAFNKFIFDSIVCCQKRSKMAYKSYFIESKYIEDYYKELLALYNDLYNIKSNNKKEIEKMWYKIDTLYLNYANDYVEKIIHPAIVHYTKRTESNFIDVPIPDVPIREWKAVHDLMDYGDIEETIYRGLFKAGCIRIEIKLPDKNGEIKDVGKIYYIDDPEPLSPKTPNELMRERILKPFDDKEKIGNRLQSLIYNDEINIAQSAWKEYNDMLGNTITY